jgi:hypothetical protein
MTTYTVSSDRLAGFKSGDTVRESQLESLNVDALVSAGHLVAVSAASKNKIEKKEDN